MLQLSQVHDAVVLALTCIDVHTYLPRQRRLAPSIPWSWLLAALIWFGVCGMRNFKRYVQVLLPLRLTLWRLSYSRWMYWRAQLQGVLDALARHWCWAPDYFGVALVDSTALAVGAAHRMKQQKCFTRSRAAMGHNGIGYFHGYKLHAVVDERGRVLRFAVSPGNSHDNTPLKRGGLVARMKGTLVGDSAYFGAELMRALAKQGLLLLARPPKTRVQAMPAHLRELLGKRWRIETAFGQMKRQLGMDRSGCRTEKAFLSAVLAALCAYQLEVLTKLA